MGRLTLILFASVYLFFSVGIIKATHFCMGRVASVALFTAEAKKCPCSLYAEEKGSCCKDEHKLIKIENEQKVVSIAKLSVPVWFKIQDLYSVQLLTAAQPLHQHAGTAVDESPPPKLPLWKFYCAPVFYDDGLIA